MSNENLSFVEQAIKQHYEQLLNCEAWQTLNENQVQANDSTALRPEILKYGHTKNVFDIPKEQAELLHLLNDSIKEFDALVSAQVFNPEFHKGACSGYVCNLKEIERKMNVVAGLMAMDLSHLGQSYQLSSLTARPKTAVNPRFAHRYSADSKEQWKENEQYYKSNTKQYERICKDVEQQDAVFKSLYYFYMDQMSTYFQNNPNYKPENYGKITNCLSEIKKQGAPFGLGEKDYQEYKELKPWADTGDLNSFRALMKEFIAKVLSKPNKNRHDSVVAAAQPDPSYSSCSMM